MLHQVTVPIIENSKCQEMFTKSGHKKIVRESFLCAGYDEGKKDSCEVSLASSVRRKPSYSAALVPSVPKNISKEKLSILLRSSNGLMVSGE